MKRILFASIFASSVLLLPQAALAWCVGTKSMDIPVATPLSISGPGDANIVGKQIGNWGGTKTDKMAFVLDTCKPEVYYSYAEPQQAPIAGLTHVSDGISYPVYPTTIPGVGYVIGIKDPNAKTWTSISPPRTQVYPSAGTGTGPAPGSLGFTAQVKLIATGRIKAGTYTSPQQQIGTLKAATQSGAITATNIPLYLGTFTLTATTKGCTVTRGADQAVNLPGVATRSFSGIGSNSSLSASFSVALACDGGVSVYATMTDVTNPSNTSDILTLTKDSTATGIGVRIFKSGDAAAVRFGPDSSAIGNTNQWFIGASQSNGTSFVLPFVAKYVQSAAQIGVGNVSARSSITFSYQ